MSPFDFRLIAKDERKCNVRIDQIAFPDSGKLPRRRRSGGIRAGARPVHAGEALGYDGAWIRQRSRARRLATFRGGEPATRIGLGAAVIQMGYENPFRLAEDLRRRAAQRRLSAGADSRALLGERLFDTDPERVDFSHARVARLRRNLAGDWLGDEDTFVESAARKVRPRVASHRA